MNFKVLNLLSGGGVGGIENLCKSISDVGKFENCFCCLFDEGPIYDEIKQNGDAVSLKKYGDKKLNLERIRALYKLAKNYDIIVVHHSAIVIQVYYSILKRLLPRKKYVLIAHSCFSPEFYYNYNSALKNRIRAILQKHVLQVSDKLIFVSHAGERSYREYFELPDEKCCVVYNGVKQQNIFRRPEHITVDKNHLYQIVFVGRLETIKGVHLLIEAIAELHKKYNVVLRVVGYGEEQESLERLTQKLGVADVIQFEGMQRNIGKYLKEADIFVYPSICEEVFGISIVEAMSYGVPCVANCVGGIPEIILDGKNGKLSKDKTGADIGKAIEWLIMKYQKNEIDALVDQCYKTAEFFSINQTVSGLEKCYLNLLKNN